MKKHAEHFFLLIMAGVICFITFCATGGGGNSCETIQCGDYDEEEGSFYGVSIPGCGGCLTPGKGCGGCLWPQSCKVLYGSTETNSPITFVGMDNRYFSGGCLGCGQSEESCYNGFVIQDAKNWGCAYGSTESDEHLIGCADGCGGCFASDGSAAYIIGITEAATGID